LNFQAFTRVAFTFRNSKKGNNNMQNTTKIPAQKEKTSGEPTIRNHLIFALVMRKKKMVMTCLERILGIEIRDIVYIEPEKTIEVAATIRGIRVDVYCANDDAVYNIELQAYFQTFLGKRSRYYQDMLDMTLLQKGESYKKLKYNIVIFICTFDPFGYDRYMYTFENRCKEIPSLSLGDETTKIFLNTTGNIGDIPSPLKSFLHYIETNEVTDDYTREIDKEVIEVRNDDKWRNNIMTIEQVLEDCAYDTELKTTEKVTKKVTNDVTRKFVFRMLDRNLSDEEICELADIPMDQFAAYKEEYDKQKSE